MIPSQFHVVGRALSFLVRRSPFLLKVRNSSGYKLPANWKPAHMDEMPIPNSPWKTHYKMKQSAYNTQLSVGLLAFMFTILFITKSDRFQFNYYPPPLPGDDIDITFRPEC